MPVEFPDHFLAACDLKRMSTEYPLQAANQGALTGPLRTDQHQRNLGLPIGVLNGPSNPADKVIRELRVAPSDYLLDVLADQLPIPGRRLKPPTLPQVQTAVHHGRAIRPKRHATILAAL